ncbi:MAG: MBL fold metallo-hydrolase [Gammaproteobacteria bacterium]|nr:MBL fold metallo-hydrolase [Gammaproteobacteria bacterium]
MNFRFYRYLLILLAGAISFAIPAQEDRFAGVEIKTEQVTPGIYMLVGAGGNIGVSAGEDGVFMIDDQFAPLTDRITAAVAALSDQPIRFLINTHWHGDHTGGNENLGNQGALIVAHDNVYARMSTDTEIGAFNQVVPAAPKAALPVITFNDNVTFRLNGEEIRAVHYRSSHTDGDSVIQFVNANVVHTGDIWFNGYYPFIDVSSGGSIDGVVSSIGKLIDLADDNTRIIPGHGPLGDKQGLRSYLEMLETVRDRMNKLIAEGKSLEQIIELRPNADYDDSMGAGFINPEKFLEILYSDLTR